ncbi:MAG: GNAT family N-acetyltransferase [Candidatus Lokiarchaeota archaeon]|nr:GNAT family N-acetyltransferase [Candidatus Lokiarchaeota archaeon]
MEYSSKVKALNVKIRHVRISDAEKIARVNIDTWRIAYTGVINEKTLQNLSYSDKANRWRNRIESLGNHTVIFVAEVDEDLVGFILASQEQQEPTTNSSRYKGELMAIYVSEKIQRKAIGTQLVLKVVSYLIKSNVNSMCVWSLKGNSYSSFYIKLGGKQFDSKPHRIDQNEYTLVGYGWNDIKSIMN